MTNDLNGLCVSLAATSVAKRLEAAEMLIDIVVGVREALVVRLAEERNELVLLNLLELLEVVGRIDEAFDNLEMLSCRDRRPLVRAYAISCLPNYNSRRATEVLVERLSSEKNRRVRLEILLAMYRLDYDGVFQEIVAIAESSDQETTCAAINGLLATRLREQDEKELRNLVAVLAVRESRAPVREAASRALQLLNGKE